MQSLVGAMASTNKSLAQMNNSPKVTAGVVQKIHSGRGNSVRASKEVFGPTTPAVNGWGLFRPWLRGTNLWPNPTSQTALRPATPGGRLLLTFGAAQVAVSAGLQVVEEPRARHTHRHRVRRSGRCQPNLERPQLLTGTRQALERGTAVIYRVFITDGGYVVIDADSRKRRCSSCVMPDLSR